MLVTNYICLHYGPSLFVKSGRNKMKLNINLPVVRPRPTLRQREILKIDPNQRRPIKIEIFKLTCNVTFYSCIIDYSISVAKFEISNVFQLGRIQWKGELLHPLRIWDKTFVEQPNLTSGNLEFRHLNYFEWGEEGRRLVIDGFSSSFHIWIDGRIVQNYFRILRNLKKKKLFRE